MPGLRKILKRWLTTSYDYLGLVLLISFPWLGVVFGGITLVNHFARGSFLAAALGIMAFYVLVIAPMTAAAHYVARKMVIRDDPIPLDILVGLREMLIPAWRLSAAQLLVTLILAINCWFYLTRGGMPLKILGTVFIYLLLLWGISSIYHYPLLIEQRPGAFKTIKKAILLALDNLAFTCALFFVIILLTCLSAVTLLGLPLLYMGVLATLQTRALRALFVKYELLEPEREPSEEAPKADAGWSIEPVKPEPAKASDDRILHRDHAD